MLFWYNIFQYFLKHPAIGGSAIYIFFSAIGAIYAKSLYFCFGVNIFDYAETNDFFMFAFKEPQIYGIFLEWPLLIANISTVTVITILTIAAKRGDIFVTIRLQIYSALIASIVLIIFFVYITLDRSHTFAQDNAERLVENKESTVNVLYEKGKKESTSVVEKLELSLIGSTEKFMFFYNYSDKCTIVIPITKIISITANKKEQKNKLSEGH